MRSADHAVSSSIVHPDRRWGNPVADQPVHPNGRLHQVDLERSRRNLRGDVAPQCIWIAALPLKTPRRIANALHTRQRAHLRASDSE